MKRKVTLLAGALLATMVLSFGLVGSVGAEEPDSWWEQMFQYCHGTSTDQTNPNRPDTGQWGPGGMMGGYGGMMGGSGRGGMMGGNGGMMGGWNQGR
ncbi:MAG: hypothetical protein HY675_05825 [Chloroflexi bacterium]|nr:hypothetical protein [Chloroflexota bacterium]